MRSIVRFAFVVVPTAALASAVVVGVSTNRGQQVATADGDLQRDLQLASTESIELTPVGPAVATVSAIESPPAAAPERSVRPKRSRSGSRVVRSRAPTVTAAPVAEDAASADNDETSVATDLAAAPAEETAAAPADGGVALPRPTAIPVAFPTGSGDAGTYDPGPGTVIRGGGVFGGDHCQIHGGRGGRVYGQPVYRQPRGGGVSMAERIRRGGDGSRGGRGSIGGSSQSSGPRSSLGSLIRQGSSSSARSSGSVRSSGSGGSIAGRIRGRGR